MIAQYIYVFITTKMMENFENVNHLVLNFYLDGYSIAVKLNEFPVFTSETILETARISYEETSLLDYIEHEELPPLLVEMIDSSPKLSQYKIWHNGCLILEVRDKIESSLSSHSVDDHNETHSYRSQSAAKYVSQSALAACYDKSAKLNDCDKSDNDATNKKHFILLKPTNLSMLYDVLNLTDSKCWSAQERLQLESQIVLHNSPDLSLEPAAEPSASQTTTTTTTTTFKAAEDQPAHDSPAYRDANFCGTNMSSPIKEMDSNGNSEYSKLKIGQQSASQKPRLKDIYMNRAIHVSHTKSNGGGNNTSNNGGSKTNGRQQSRIHSLYHNNSHRQQQQQQHETANNSNHCQTHESFPPELTLQQFLAARRTTRQNSFPFGPTPRFHRYKQSRSYK